MKLLNFILVFLMLLPFVFAHEGHEHTDSEVKLPVGLQKLIEYETQKAQAITLLAAFLAGLVAISSPCGFVLIPAFLSYSLRDKRKTFLATTAFSLGIIITFIVLGIIASIVGNFFNDYKNYFAVISGVVIVIFGFMILLNKGFSFFTPKIAPTKKSFVSYLVFGMLFAGGWTPCIGPVLSSILFLAANTASTIKAVILLAVYSLGIVIPLFILALLSDKLNITKYFKGKLISFTLLKKQIHTTTYNIFSAIILLVLGIVMILYNGTYPFETFVQTKTPWTMSILSNVNSIILSSPILKNTWANIIGFLIVLIIILLIIYLIKKEFRNKIHKLYKE